VLFSRCSNPISQLVAAQAARGYTQFSSRAPVGEVHHHEETRVLGMFWKTRTPRFFGADS